jgi:hypothetical protein
METTIHQTNKGFFAQNGNATTQYFGTKQELEEAIKVENELIAEQGLCVLAIPQNSPLVWS